MDTIANKLTQLMEPLIESPKPPQSTTSSKKPRSDNSRRKSWVFGTFSNDGHHSRSSASTDRGSYSRRNPQHASSLPAETVIAQPPPTDSMHGTGHSAEDTRPRKQTEVGKHSYAEVTTPPLPKETRTRAMSTRVAVPAETGSLGQTERPSSSGVSRSARTNSERPERPAPSGEDSDVEAVQRMRSGTHDSSTHTRSAQKNSSTTLSSVPTNSAGVIRSRSRSSAVDTSSSRGGHHQSSTVSPSNAHDPKAKDRDSQHMYEKYQEMRQRLTDQEQRYKDEKENWKTHYSRAIQEKRDLEQTLAQERQQYAAEVERLQAALQASNTLSETRAKELSSARTFPAVTDDSSGADVVKLVSSLNDQVLQFAAQFIDAVEVRDVENQIQTDEGERDISKAKEHFRDLFGDLVDMLPTLKVENLEFVSQCALQAILLELCTEVIHAWSWNPGVNAALKGIYSAIQQSIPDPALQTISTRWRVLTLAQSRANWDAVSAQIIESATDDAIALQALICDSRPSNAQERERRRKWTSEKVADILRTARQIGKVIGEGITSTDYVIFCPRPGELFDTNRMSDDNEIKGDPDRNEQSQSATNIICTCQLGIHHRDPLAEHHQVILKARVLLPSAMS